jgi:hypothetical protein
MRFHGLEVSVRADGKNLPEVQHKHTTYVVAKPGSEYSVDVTVHPDIIGVRHGRALVRGIALPRHPLRPCPQPELLA